MNYIEQFTAPHQDRIEVLYDMLCGDWLQQHKHNETKLRITYRHVANAIHDCGIFWTGYISKAALERIVITNKPPVKICTNDHFYGRNNSGEVITKSFLNAQQPTINQFAEMMYTHCKVHKVLKEENNRVTPFQNNKGVSWKGAYKNAKIELIYISMDNKKNLTRKILKQHQYESIIPLTKIKC